MGSLEPKCPTKGVLPLPGTGLPLYSCHVQWLVQSGWWEEWPQLQHGDWWISGCSSWGCCNYTTAWVCSGCHTKIPQTECLKQQKFISHGSGGWEIQDQGTGNVGFILRTLLLACRPLSSYCVLTWSCLCVERERELSGVSSYKDTNPIRPGPYP